MQEVGRGEKAEDRVRVQGMFPETHLLQALPTSYRPIKLQTHPWTHGILMAARILIL